MNTILEPRPTDYKGIRFRSKTEAVYARFFDLINWKWEYEPLVHGWPHSPDFIICSNTDVVISVTEVKPLRPSGAYLEGLIKPATLISGMPRHQARLLYGNPWDGDCVNVVKFIDGVWLDPVCLVGSDELLREASSFRFDLKHEI